MFIKSGELDLSRLYLITDRKRCDDILFVAEEALKNGLRMIQLREKDLPSVELYELAMKMRHLTAKYDALLLINDRVDIALAVSADGVHIGKGSMPVPVVRYLSMDRDFIIGYSVHSVVEAFEKEAEGVDFITISPIFTPSRKGYKVESLGECILDNLASISIPVYSLGGIKCDNISLLGAGYGVALISDIVESDDPGARVRELFSVISSTFS